MAQHTSASDVSVYTVNRLKLASWLYINNEQLISRRLDPLGQHIIYCFINSDRIEPLVNQWLNKEGVVALHAMAVFAESVSFEIRIAARLRRGEDISSVQPPRRLKGDGAEVSAA